MLILVLPIILFCIPIIIQSSFASKASRQKNILSFVLISLGSLVLEGLMMALGLFISLKGQQMQEVPSLSPGVIGFGIFAIIVLIGIILFQIIMMISRR
ncbi:MAG: hypothetical protein IPH88_05610 [Bacteroidales bacterium]|nr:hypothetical protein [Bacteroidales bacterium]